MRSLWAALRRLGSDQRGFSDYVALAIVTPLALMAFVGGSAIVETVSAQAALHTAAGMADRSLVADGCLTANAVQAMDATLRAAHMKPSQMTLTTTAGASRLYGSRGLGVTVGYHIPLTFPGTPWVITTRYATAQVSNDQSQYVPYDGAGHSACAPASVVAATFSGSAGTAGGSSVQLPAEPTAVSETVTPNPDTVGSALTVRGVVTNHGSPLADVPVSVAIGSQVSTTVATNAQGQYSAALTPTQAGTAVVTVTAGPATTQQTVTIHPLAPASITLNVPSSIGVGQAFAVQGTVLAANGQPVANGTRVTVASSDPANIPTQTVTTVAGRFTVAVPQGVTTLGTVTVTATAGSVRQTARIAVQPGPPQSVTLTLSPVSGRAGSSWTVSGTVLGPDQTPVAPGTTVQLTSSTDTRDTLPTFQTNAQGQFAGSVTLTVAGSQTFTAQAGTAQSAPVSVIVTPGPAMQVVSMQAAPNPVNQGATTVIIGTVLDAYGNPEPAGVAITLSSTAWRQPVTTTTGSGGTFQVPVSFNQAGNQVVQAAVGSTPLANGTITVAVNAEGAYTLSASQSSTTMTAGTTQTVTWTLVDSEGNPVPNVPLTFSATPSSGTILSETHGTTNRQGQVTMTVSAAKAGTLTVTATAKTSPNTTGTATWRVQPAAPALVDPPIISPAQAVSTQDGGKVYPTISGVALDAYGNPIADATVQVTGGWDPGVTFTGTTNAQGYFAIPLDPVVIGGPYDPTVTVSDAQGRSTKTYTNTRLTVTTKAAILPPGTPTDYTVTLTGQVGNYNTGYPWYQPANVQLTATVSPSVSGTIWSIGIYDETQGQWVGQCDTGTSCTVNALSDFTAQGQSDTYVAVVGVMKYSAGTNSGLPWAHSLILAKSAPLTLTLPQIQYAYTGLYPNVWGGAPYFTGWPIAFDSTASIQFQNAAMSARAGFSVPDPIQIVGITQGGPPLTAIPYPEGPPETWFELNSTTDPVAVQYQYTIPNAPRPPNGQSAWTATLPPPSLTPWTVTGCSSSEYGLICTTNTWSSQLWNLTLSIPYGGQTYTTSLDQQASSSTGYNFQAYFGGQPTAVYDSTIWTATPITLTGAAVLNGYGVSVNLACKFTEQQGQITAGYCQQTSTQP